MGKAGRPRIEIDWKKAQNLAKIHCTCLEICMVLGVSEDTLTRAIKKEKNPVTGVKFNDFADWFEAYSSAGRASLRRRQWQLAQAGNVTMLQWLGLNLLGQSPDPKIPEGSPEKYTPPASMEMSPAEIAAYEAAERVRLENARVALPAPPSPEEIVVPSETAQALGKIMGPP